MILTMIGSRYITFQEKVTLEIIASMFEEKYSDQFIGRSGGADGSDTCIENGVKNKGRLEIYLPWDGFNGRHSKDGSHFLIPADTFTMYDESIKIARSVHPVFDSLDANAKAFHTRNVYQALGKKLDLPSDICICCSNKKGNDGKVHGGTATAVQISLDNNVPVYNIRYPNQLFDFLGAGYIDKLEFFKRYKQI